MEWLSYSPGSLIRVIPELEIDGNVYGIEDYIPAGWIEAHEATMEFDR